MVDIRVNNIFWYTAENRSKAAHRLGCGYFDNGRFDGEEEALAKKVLRARDASKELADEAQGYLDGRIDRFVITYSPAE